MKKIIILFTLLLTISSTSFSENDRLFDEDDIERFLRFSIGYPTEASKTNKLRTWDKDHLKIYPAGTPTEDDIKNLEKLLADMQVIAPHMKFELISFKPGLKPDIVIYFTQLEMFNNIFQLDNANSNDGWAKSRTYALENSVLYRANIAISDKLEDPDSRNEVMRALFARSMGFTQTPTSPYPQKGFHNSRESRLTTDFNELETTILGMMLHPNVKAGMQIEELRETFQNIKN